MLVNVKGRDILGENGKAESKKVNKKWNEYLGRNWKRHLCQLHNLLAYVYLFNLVEQNSHILNLNIGGFNPCPTFDNNISSEISADIFMLSNYKMLD
jgi:hypothetical protein